jgi:hypothetical protein
VSSISARGRGHGRVDHVDRVKMTVDKSSEGTRGLGDRMVEDRQ